MSKDLVVVGIGSSAGGLEALQIMFANLPEIANCSYVIAQHLSPTHRSMMVDLLSRITNIPVIGVKNGMIIKAKTIYMTPENTDIYISDGKLYLKSIEQAFGPKPSVNTLFGTLAADFKEKAIGVILSGTGSDGAYGVRAIKAEGGITIAQSPNTAKYDGMPLSAINTGKVDLVASIDKMSSEIESIVYSMGKDFSISSDERTLQQIYRILFEEYGVDFSLYKHSTVNRRIERRIAALKQDSLQNYFKLFEKNNIEISNLYHDILIGVTSFFRDKAIFELFREYIKPIIEKKEFGEEIRLWSIGCSTGEEAYSIAIILSEILGENISKYKIKIFATDIDDEALKIARAGVYADTSLAEVGKNIIQKYFSVQKNQYEVKKSLRELVIFSHHNVVSDSPFLRLDWVTCRNMLIYFSGALQDKFFPVIHYALRDNGILFLGKSESIGHHIDLFSVVDKNAKIYKAQYIGVKEPPKLFSYSSTLSTYEEPKIKKFKNDEQLLEEKIVEALGVAVLDKAVVINNSNDLVYIKGKIPYLSHQSGKMSNNIFKLIGEELTLDLRTALNEVSKEKKPRMTPFRSLKFYEDIVKYVRIVVIPILDERSNDWFNILFFQDEDIQNIQGHIINDQDESETIIKLTHELDITKSHLQNVIEELETSYEEMQSLNEELQSSNEELQSSNEELETTNEELQSTNEELQTAYSELRMLYDDKDERAKQLEGLMDKLALQTEDLRKQKEITEAILETAPIAVSMVDANGRLSYINKYAEKLYETSKKTLLGRSFDSSQWNITDYNGNPKDKKNLPFAIIKQTFEPLYDLRQTIEQNGIKKYLCVSGAPLFDVQGTFVGAVFCIQDDTASENLKDDVVYYKNSLEHKDQAKRVDSYDMMKLSLLDLVTGFKNDLNHIELLSQAMRKNTSHQITDKITQHIKLLSQNLDDKINFYTKKITYERTNILDEIEYFCQLFDPILKRHSISIIKNLDNKSNFNLKAYRLKHFFYNVFEFLIALSKELQKNSDSVSIEIVNSTIDEHHCLHFTIKDVTFDVQTVIQKLEVFRSIVETEELKVEPKITDNISFDLHVLSI